MQGIGQFGDSTWLKIDQFYFWRGGGLQHMRENPQTSSLAHTHTICIMGKKDKYPSAHIVYYIFRLQPTCLVHNARTNTLPLAVLYIWRFFFFISPNSPLHGLVAKNPFCLGVLFTTRRLGVCSYYAANVTYNNLVFHIFIITLIYLCLIEIYEKNYAEKWRADENASISVTAVEAAQKTSRDYRWQRLAIDVTRNVEKC